jgi:hypothetical protein
MRERKRGTVRDLRRENRAAVLWSLYLGQPRNRQELSASTGLSAASVTNVIRELPGTPANHSPNYSGPVHCWSVASVQVSMSSRELVSPPGSVRQSWEVGLTSSPFDSCVQS